MTTRVLAIDVGGTHVKLLATGQTERRRFVSGATMTPEPMVAAVKAAVTDWTYEVVSLGYPGFVFDGRIVCDPVNLGGGWVGFDFAQAFGCRVRIINDAAMQALGSYQGGRMLFLGFGTGLGSAMVIEGIPHPMEIGHLTYKKGKTYEDYVGARALARMGERKWRANAEDIIARLGGALDADYVVLGGGNAKLLTAQPPHTLLGANNNAFLGAYRLWEAPFS